MKTLQRFTDKLESLQTDASAAKCALQDYRWEHLCKNLFLPGTPPEIPDIRYLFDPLGLGSIGVTTLILYKDETNLKTTKRIYLELGESQAFDMIQQLLSNGFVEYDGPWEP